MKHRRIFTSAASKAIHFFKARQSSCGSIAIYRCSSFWHAFTASLATLIHVMSVLVCYETEGTEATWQTPASNWQLLKAPLYQQYKALVIYLYMYIEDLYILACGVYKSDSRSADKTTEEWWLKMHWQANTRWMNCLPVLFRSLLKVLNFIFVSTCLCISLCRKNMQEV